MTAPSSYAPARSARASAILIVLLVLLAVSRPVVTNALTESLGGRAAASNSIAARVPDPVVVAVPWAGSEANSHVVYSGGSIVLQAVATYGGLGEPVPLTSASWDPGDGSGPQAISVSDPRALELVHSYTGQDFTPFTATITVTDTADHTYTDTFKVRVMPRTLETEISMAIDRGLWAQHKAMLRSADDSGQTLGRWTDGERMAATSAAIQGFQVNGHRQTLNPLKDPYADNVARGLRYLQANIRRVPISSQTGGDPDVNGNGYGLEVDYGEPVYVVGQVVDAFVASGTPLALATVGTETGRTYADIVQDLLDSYAYGQNEDGYGGWVYQWNGQDGVDSSSSAWWGVGQLAAEVFGVSSPAWTKTLNATLGVPALQDFNLTHNAEGQGAHGGCSYRQAGGDHSVIRTAACMILMSADGMSRSSSRFASAEAYLARYFSTGELHGSMYAMYNVAKAMRTAKDGTGTPSPIVMMGGTVDWYNADPYPGNWSHRENGLARYLVGWQNGNGQWPNGGWVDGTLSSAYAILILSPSLFEQAPTAVCSVDSTVVCQAGADGGCNATGTNPYANVLFDGSLSTAGDNPISSYAWNFQDGATATGVSTSHTFSTVGSFGVRLTVADTKGNSSSVVCPVQVTSGALPPVASVGGPYEVCLNRPGPITLDATGSMGRTSQIVGYQWDFTTPVNFSPSDATTATVQTALFSSLAPGTYDIGVRVTDNTPNAEGGPFTDTRYGTVTVRGADDPACNAAPVATNNAYVTARNTAVTGNVITDGTPDSDADGDTFTAAVVSAPAQGTLNLSADGAFTYTPQVDFSGTVTFTYRLTDQRGKTSTAATVTIDVRDSVVAKMAELITMANSMKMSQSVYLLQNALRAGLPSIPGCLELNAFSLQVTAQTGKRTGPTASQALLLQQKISLIRQISGCS